MDLIHYKADNTDPAVGEGPVLSRGSMSTRHG